MTKYKSTFKEEAERRDAIQVQERKLRAKELVRIPGTDSVISQEEYKEILTDLESQGLTINKPGESGRDVKQLYLTDTCLVEVRPLTEADLKTKAAQQKPETSHPKERREFANKLNYPVQHVRPH